MDLSQLRAFIVLSELKHFGYAATRLHITQPALTKRIQGLEAKIGVPLFRRDRTGTALTPSGKSLLPDAIRIVADANAWLVRAQNVAKGIEGHLEIGFGLSTIEVAPRVVARFRRAYPAAVVSLNDFSSAEQLNRLENGRLNLGFVRLPVLSSALLSCLLGSDRLALATLPGDTTAPSLASLETWNSLGFVMLNRQRGPGLRAQIDDWCRASGFRPNITQIADDIQTVLALVAAGVGVSIVPQQAMRLMGDAVRIHPLGGIGADWQIGAAWRLEDSSPILRSFLGMMDDEYRRKTSE